MENEKYIVLQSNMAEYQKLRDEIKNNPQKKLALLNTDFNYVFDKTIKFIDGGFRYYNVNYRIKFGKDGNMFLLPNKKDGFIFKNGKITCWFNTKTINNIDYEVLVTILEKLKCDWILKYAKQYSQNTRFNLKYILNKEILEKILSNKITNPKQLVRTYTKSLFGIKCDNWKLMQYTMINHCNMIPWLTSLRTKGVDFSILKNPSKSIKRMCEIISRNEPVNINSLTIILRYYSLLDKKIDVSKWSDRRFVNEYWHIQSLIKKANMLTDENIYGCDFSFDTVFGTVKLITNEMEFAKLMEECKVNTSNRPKWLKRFRDKESLFLCLQAHNGNMLYQCKFVVHKILKMEQTLPKYRYSTQINMLHNSPNINITVRDIITALDMYKPKLSKLLNYNVNLQNLNNLECSNILDEIVMPF